MCRHGWEESNIPLLHVVPPLSSLSVRGRMRSPELRLLPHGHSEPLVHYLHCLIMRRCGQIHHYAQICRSSDSTIVHTRDQAHYPFRDGCCIECEAQIAFRTFGVFRVRQYHRRVYLSRPREHALQHFVHPYSPSQASFSKIVRRSQIYAHPSRWKWIISDLGR